LLIEQKQRDFFFGVKLFTFVCYEPFLSLIYILTQIQEMSNFD